MAKKNSFGEFSSFEKGYSLKEVNEYLSQSLSEKAEEEIKAEAEGENLRAEKAGTEVKQQGEEENNPLNESLQFEEQSLHQEDLKRLSALEIEENSQIEKEALYEKEAIIKEKTEKTTAEDEPKEHHKNDDKHLKIINSKRLTAVLVAAIILVGCFFGVRSLLNRNKDSKGIQAETDVVGIQSGIMPGMSDWEIYDWNNKQKDISEFVVNFNNNLVFENAASSGHLRLINPPYSAYPVSIELVIREKDTDKIVYASDIVYPGQYLANIRLDLRMKKGVYDAYAIFKHYGSLGKSEISRQKINMIITVKK